MHLCLSISDLFMSTFTVMFYSLNIYLGSLPEVSTLWLCIFSICFIPFCFDRIILSASHCSWTHDLPTTTSIVLGLWVCAYLFSDILLELRTTSGKKRTCLNIYWVGWWCFLNRSFTSEIYSWKQTWWSSSISAWVSMWV